MTIDELHAKISARVSGLAGPDWMIGAVLGATLAELGIAVDEATGTLSQNPVTSPLAWKAPEQRNERYAGMPSRRRRR